MTRTACVQNQWISLSGTHLGGASRA